MNTDKRECNKCKKMVDRELACEIEDSGIYLCSECLDEEIEWFSEDEVLN